MDFPGLLILIFLIFIVFSIFIGIVKNITTYCEYKSKLNKLEPCIQTIETDDLTAKLSVIQESYLLLVESINNKYNIYTNKELDSSIKQYIQEEADYKKLNRRLVVRSNFRKPTKNKNRHKYNKYRYRRYY